MGTELVGAEFVGAELTGAEFAGAELFGAATCVGAIGTSLAKGESDFACDFGAGGFPPFGALASVPKLLPFDEPLLVPLLGIGLPAGVCGE